MYTYVIICVYIYIYTYIKCTYSRAPKRYMFRLSSNLSDSSDLMVASLSFSPSIFAPVLSRLLITVPRLSTASRRGSGWGGMQGLEIFENATDQQCKRFVKIHANTVIY